MRAGLAAAAALIASAAAVAGCSSRAGSTAAAPVSHMPLAAASAATLYQSPEQATVSWFYSINHKDAAAAVAHFEPADAESMNWYGGPSKWPTFSDLRCHQMNADAVTAEVYCTFNESLTPSVGQPDNFWTVELHRQPDGRWLISNYGTG